MKYITIYLDAVAARGCVAGTVKLYREELRRADRFFTARAIADEKAITERDILDYLEYLKACLSPHQYYKEVTGLKRYLLFCEARGLIFYSPMADIESPKRVRLTKPIFQQEEITAILGRIGSDNDADIRNHAMLMVGYSSTLRPGEVTRLKLQDIDWSNRLLFIEQSKNRKDRIVPVGQEALDAVAKYLADVRPKYIRQETHSILFITMRHGHRMEVHTYQQSLLLTLQRYNIPQFYPGLMRPSGATHLLQNGASTIHIQKLLGHSTITTTEEYLRIGAQDVKKQMETRHPRTKWKDAIREIVNI
jgi:integrase/recombinase XerD